MRLRYHFFENYNAKYHERLLDYLKENHIKVSPDKEELDGEFITFSVWSSSSDYARIINELKEMRIEYMCVYAEYTKKELESAEFLMMYPKRQFMEIINCEDAYKYSCENGNRVEHEEQIGLFAIKKEPSSKTKTAFWAEDTGFAEVFTDYRVREMVEANGLSGIEFKNVMNMKYVVSENIFQMTSTNIIDRSWIGMGYGEKIKTCRICGKEQYVFNNTYQLHLDLTKMNLHQDLYMTERIFGDGIAGPLYVISKRFYRLLRENNLDGGINLSPVISI